MIGREIDLLSRYPKTSRNLDQRVETKTPESRAIARKFGFDYFDGKREHGYGGFAYHPRFWTEVIQDLISTYNLTSASSVLDIGCAKGFFLYDLAKALPGIKFSGVDISEYALKNSLEEVRDNLLLGNATSLDFPDGSFDLVISINTIHNLNRGDCKKALAEIQRVSKKHAFITVDAYRDEEEKERMEAWNLTALTMMSTDEWKEFFKEAGYKGDFYWFIP
jgi:ubiquinone/menaquinone biosynthesis C-methylase UbiE